VLLHFIWYETVSHAEGKAYLYSVREYISVDNVRTWARQKEDDEKNETRQDRHSSPWTGHAVSIRKKAPNITFL
jgi:hypothetical protein